jgi:ribonuclease HI
MRTIVYADGGCDPNPGPGGWGAVIAGPEGAIELCGGEGATTNNRMELTAAIRALEHFPEGAAIEMRCDSQYVVKSATEWMKGWKARGWRTATGPVKNIDLMQRLDELASQRDVRWTWVRGHAGEAGNERADCLATQGRRQVLGLPIEPYRPTQAAAPRPMPIAIDHDLSLRITDAARLEGLTPQAFVERATRLALDLGPDGIARARQMIQPSAPKLP